MTAGLSERGEAGSDPHDAYRQLLVRYRLGEREAVVREIANWEEKRVTALRSTSTLNPPGAAFGNLGEGAADIETAVALHTRVAVTRAEALTSKTGPALNCARG